MKGNKRHIQWSENFLLAIIFLLLFNSLILGNDSFIVVSTTPSDGATLVDPNGTFEITFSAPLDTTVRFDYPSDFFINLMLEPDSLVGEPEAIYLDPTLTTLYVENLNLEMDTKYILYINNAVSINNDSLSMPFIATFTTAMTLPTASVSGTISFENGDPKGTVVTLMTQTLFSDNESNTEAASIVQTSGGEYTIRYVTPGTYWPVAFWNFNIDSQGDMSPGDEIAAFAFYDPDGDMQQDSIVITEGDSIINIDMNLMPLEQVTARLSFDVVNDVAIQWAADAKLVQVRGMDINENGEGLVWQYVYYSQNMNALYSWVAVGPIIMPQALGDEDFGEIITLPENWIDSDIAADSAEYHGGREFREQHDNVDIMAVLGYSFPLGGDDDNGSQQIFKNFKASQAKSMSFPRLNKGNFNQYKPFWFFMYNAEEDEEYSQMFYIIDAITGKYYDKVTARNAEVSAAEVVQTLATDAELVSAYSPSFVMEGVQQDGKANFWQFNYYSETLDSIIGVVTVNGIVLGLATGDDFENVQVKPLPENWIDSDVAAFVAEENGGDDYRNDNEGVSVSAVLAAGQMFFGFDKAVWLFTYYSYFAEPLNIFIDAVTGEPLTLGPITARVAENAASDSAKAWAADAALASMGAGFHDLFNKEGKSVSWDFAYYSESLSEFINISTLYGVVVNQWTYHDDHIFAQIPLPVYWMDSDTAAAIADANGGEDFRHSHISTSITATLRRGEYFPDQLRAVWHFTYRAIRDSLHIYFDCISGQVLTKVESFSEAENTPTSFQVKQNYPNPFNPETTMSYGLPTHVHVKIDIYSILGEHIIKLIDEEKDAGYYNVRWNAKDKFGQSVPSGIYIYKISAGNYNKILKMTLIR